MACGGSRLFFFFFSILPWVSIVESILGDISLLGICALEDFMDKEPWDDCVCVAL